MKLRTSRGLVAIALGTALVLSGCASGDGGSASPSPSESAPADTGVAAPTAEDIAAVEAIKVTGDIGTEPAAEFDTPFTVSTATARIDVEGTGADLEEGQQLTMKSILYAGKDASVLGSMWGDESQVDTITLGDPSLYPVLNEILTGQKVGTRFIFAAPGQDGSTSISIVEVTGAKTIPTRAEGEAVTPADGLPVVTLDDTGKPSIAIPEGYTAPTELVTQTLIKGTGPEVAADDTITANYTGWKMDGTVFDSSWENGSPLNIPLTNLVQGWQQGLVGQTVGSQVLLVIPPELAYGAEASESNPLGGETLIFVLDILDAS
ncbi:FKBP-type peptidyl-prolyl cis-trans isomerase [Oerskovia enterophila]|uniref:FKBP-type peptidyl-prolyl cis-trans isomerase n=1 Tax=Oerskovia enterophila TaxID=43678 RepID=UPI003399626D